MPSRLGAGVLALVAQHATSHRHHGYVIQKAGDDIADLPVQELTVEDAEAQCKAHSDCTAVSYSLHGSSTTTKMYFKRSHDEIYNDCWTSYAKANSYEEVDGFIPFEEGQDLSSGTFENQEDAQAQCDNDPICKGFSVRKSTQVYYLKKAWSKPHHDCWTTFVQEEDPSANDQCYYDCEQAPAAESAEQSSTYYGAAAESAEESAPPSDYYGAASDYYR